MVAEERIILWRFEPEYGDEVVSSYDFQTSVSTERGLVVLKSEFEREEHSMFPALNRISGRIGNEIGKPAG